MPHIFAIKSVLTPEAFENKQQQLFSLELENTDNR